MRLVTAFAIAIALCIGAADPGYAATIEGLLNIEGSARVSGTQIDFLPPGGGDGDFLVDPDAPGTGDFAGLDGTEGLIKDLVLSENPVGTPFSLPDFMTFFDFPGLSFRLTFIEPGVSGTGLCDAPEAPGQICTIPGSPFNLQNTRNGWTASFDVAGFVSDGTASPESSFVGTFSTQNSQGGSFQDLLDIIEAGGFVEATYSAQFNVTPEGLAPIPEPGSIFLFGAGLLGLGYIRRRRAS